MIEVLPYLITAISSIVVTLIANYVIGQKNKSDAKISSNSVNREHDLKLIESLMVQVATLTAEVKELKDDLNKANSRLLEYEKIIFELEAKVQEQFNHIEVLEAYFENMPGPAWMKSPTGMMFYINSAYENTWGVTKSQYEGRTDYDVWPDKTAKQFESHDKLVKTKRKGIKVTEAVPVDPDDISLGVKDWHIWKFPVFVKGSLVAIGGVAYNITDIENEKDN